MFLTPYRNTTFSTIDNVFLAWSKSIFVDSQYFGPLEKIYFSLLSLMILRSPATIEPLGESLKERFPHIYYTRRVS